MSYRLLADLIVVLHFGFVLFVIVGGFLAWRWSRIMWFHLPAAVWGALIEFAGWICPLTPLEWHLRDLAGQAGYEGGFIEYYVLPVLYPPGLTSGIQLVLGSLVVVINVVAYWGVVKRSRR